MNNYCFYQFPFSLLLIIKKLIYLYLTYRMSSIMEPLIDAIIVSSLNAGTDCIQVYDGATGTQLKSYRGLPVASSTLCLVGHGTYLMTAQRDKPFLQAWAIHRHEALQIRLVVPGKVNAMAISATGPKYCVTADTTSQLLVLYSLRVAITLHLVVKMVLCIYGAWPVLLKHYTNMMPHRCNHTVSLVNILTR
ncbi:hypothetical protein OTU49_015481 [Cherax quadricarinatus]|uniref:Uncharacterized protein n=1 Tax=Cherax quadricarinatus TaxID=27406 RepID=A0AAW0Y2V6_CHEQU